MIPDRLKMKKKIMKIHKVLNALKFFSGSNNSNIDSVFVSIKLLKVSLFLL